MKVTDTPLPIHHRIAETLCTAVTEVLLPATQSWFERPPPEERLRVRVGRGRATYCQQRRDRFTITFGVRMVAEKSVPDLATHWLTTHEMRRRGYSRDRPTVGELFAHTACHEFAHLVQQANGWWRRGSVHNRCFYHILDRLHLEGMAGRVLSHLAPRCDDGTVELQARVPLGQRSAPVSPRHPFRPGDRVSFQLRGGREVVGRIQRINRVTAAVTPEAKRYRVSYYRVPFHQLTACEE